MPKPKHDKFLQAIDELKRETKGKILSKNVYQVGGETLKTIIEHANWLKSYLSTMRGVAHKNGTLGGRPQKDESELKPLSLLRRKFRQELKTNPNLNWSEWRKEQELKTNDILSEEVEF